MLYGKQLGWGGGGHQKGRRVGLEEKEKNWKIGPENILKMRWRCLGSPIYRFLPTCTFLIELTIYQYIYSHLKYTELDLCNATEKSWRLLARQLLCQATAR